MRLTLDQQQVEILDEVLRDSLKNLRVEIIHTDTRAYRESLQRRERLVESLIALLTVDEAHPTMS